MRRLIKWLEGRLTKRDQELRVYVTTMQFGGTPYLLTSSVFYGEDGRVVLELHPRDRVIARRTICRACPEMHYMSEEHTA